jgi:outer membrane murein-binding lipoprotein Lpp
MLAMGKARGLLRVLGSGADLAAALGANVAAGAVGVVSTPVALCAVGFAAAFVLTKNYIAGRGQDESKRRVEARLGELLRQNGDLQHALNLLSAEADLHELVNQERCAKLVELVKAGDDKVLEQLAAQEGLIIHVGQWMEEWCTANGQKLDGIATQVDEIGQRLERVEDKVDGIADGVCRVANGVKGANDRLHDLVGNTRTLLQRSTASAGFARRPHNTNAAWTSPDQ